MGRRRLDMHRLQDLVRLHRLGESFRAIARTLRMSPNTERKYREALKAEDLLDGDSTDLPDLEKLKAAVQKHIPAKVAPQQVSSVEPWADEIQEMVERGAEATAIFERLKLEREDFTGTRSAVQRYVGRLKSQRGVRPQDVVVRVETDPGEVAQVDFGYVGRQLDPATGTWRRAWVFVMVLCYSRYTYARVVFDQKLETWLHLHAKAFEFFGGVPRVVVPDNLKAAVIRSAFSVSDETTLNRSYRDQARHYGFKVDPTPPRSPEKKGKVESAVKYIKGSFFKPRDPGDVRETNVDLERWLRDVAGKRIHGTTGRRPIEAFEEDERSVLSPLPAVSYVPVIWKQARVHRDYHVLFERRTYSVPWKHVGKDVWIRAWGNTLTVYLDDERIATHERRGKGYRSTCMGHNPEHRGAYAMRTREYWEERADRIGDEVGIYIREVFDSDEALSKLRTVQGIVTHLEKYPKQRAVAACERARAYANYRSDGIKRILRLALDLIPLNDDDYQGGLEQPRFARNPKELLRLPLEEVMDASNG